MRTGWALVAAIALSLTPGVAPASAAGPSAADVARAHVAGPVEVVGDATLPGTDVHVVRLRRTVEGLPVTAGGSAVVAVDDERVIFSSGDPVPVGATLRGEERLLADEAWRRAAAAVGRAVTTDAVIGRGHANGFATLGVRGFDVAQQVRRVAALTRAGDARRAFEVNVVDTQPETLAWTVLVDAESGAILRRDERVDHAADQPNWQFFASHPRLDGASVDRRVVGCFPGGPAASAPCTFDLRTTAVAAPAPWDQVGSASPTSTTSGNNADTALSQASPLAPGPDRSVRPTSPTRDYLAPWTNAWRAGMCNPTTFSGAANASGPNTFGGTNAGDVNAAIISLFANHNRMHDWSYALGFTEETYNFQHDNFGRRPEGDGDRILGDAQAGPGGSPTWAGREAASQITLQDGVSPTQTMHLWRPVAGAYYPPCVDSDFDASVIAHEYAHGIVNRMAAGPDSSLQSSSDGQARALGEGLADVISVEYLHEHGLASPDGEDPLTVGAYVSGDPDAGIRNFSMAESPLNWSDLRGYDGMAQESPHDDGEIWAAVNHDIRQAFVARYDAQFPAGDQALQLECARGRRAVTACPGNRRWIQLVFDSLLLLDADATMLEARDALIAADALRFDGAHRQELWSAFARRGFGDGASTTGTEDGQPVPSFTSPARDDESRLVLRPAAADAGGPAVVAQLFVGDYEAGATPVADTDPATPRDDAVDLLPGAYDFIVKADGYGLHRVTRDIPATSDVTLGVALPVNRASTASGGTAAGDGGLHGFLVDDTEATTWEVVGRDSGVAGARVTVDLAGGAQTVDRVNVSAMLHGTDEPAAASQNRFTALRAFTLHACTAAVANAQCTGDAGFTQIFASSADAFPGDRPRPTAPDLALRSFDIPDTVATHLRLVVVSNQCTGHAPFNDNELDQDPDVNSDCTLGNADGVARQDRTVRAAELQVFSRPAAFSVDAKPRPAETGQIGDDKATTTPAPVTDPAPPPGAGRRPAPRPVPVAADPAPVLSGVALTSRRFRIGRRLPRAAQATGTTLRFTLSEASTVTLTFARSARGRRVGRRCLPATPARRTRRACSRPVPAGTLRIPGRQGANRLAFEGRLTAGRRLAPGAYTLTVAATDRAGQRSAPRSVTFTLLRPARRR